ncbi:MAG TPA: hypothetical protein VF595_15035 [Tepidisphaeraceae bacterium]|jgi:hypothetical protein
MIRPLITRKGLFAALVLSGTLGAAARAEVNPEYQSWSKCKPGATVKIAGTSEAMGQKSSQTITTKLLELTPEKAVVESSVSIDMMGQTMNQPAVKRDVPAAVTPPDTSKLDPAVAEKIKAAIKDVKKGEETITVAGKSYKCTTTEAASDANGMKSVTKSWNSAEVPGGMVKVEVSTTGQMTSKSTMELVEFTNGN